MRKLTMILSAVIIFSTACEKEEVNPATNNNQNTKTASLNNKVSGETKKKRMFWNPHDGPTGCVPRERSCLPEDVVISGATVPMINRVFAAIESAVQSEVQNEFSINKSSLVSMLSNQIESEEANRIIDEVINGTLLVKAIYDKDDSDRFMLFSAELMSEDYRLVIPFRD